MAELSDEAGFAAGIEAAARVCEGNGEENPRREGGEMSDLPYKFTVCPPNDPPKQYTAMTKAMINAMRHGKDLTIDQRAFLYPCVSNDWEGRLSEILNGKDCRK